MAYPSSWKCPNCGTYNVDTKVCKKCGFKYSLHYPNLWICPQCGAVVKDSKVCQKCKYPTNLHYPTLWHCPKCGRLIRNSRTCPYCSRKKEKFKRIHLNILSFVGPVILFIVLVYLILSHHAPEQSNLVINDSVSSIVFPSWNVAYNGSDGIVLKNREEGIELFYFSNKAFFSDKSNDVLYMYEHLTNSSISKEYDYGSWHLICYDDGGEYCLAGAKCGQKMYYILINSFELGDELSEILLSFDCNS